MLHLTNPNIHSSFFNEMEAGILNLLFYKYVYNLTATRQ